MLSRNRVKGVTVLWYFLSFAINLFFISGGLGCKENGKINTELTDALGTAKESLKKAHSLSDEKPDSTLWYADKALQALLPEAPFDTLRYRAWELKAEAFNNLGATDSSSAYLDKWCEFALEKADSLELGKALLEKGRFHYQRSSSEPAEKSLLQALDVLPRNSKLLKASTAELLGNNYWKKGAYKQAIQFLRSADTLFGNYGNEKHAASIKNNIANVLSEIGNREDALNYYRAAAKIFGQHGDFENQSTSIQNIGILYRKIAPDSALYYYQTADSLYRMAYKKPCIICKYNTANIYLDGKNYFMAKTLLREVEAFCASEGITGGLARVYNAYAEIETGRGNYKMADQYVQKAITLSKVAGELPLTLEFLQTRLQIKRKSNPDNELFSLADEIQTLNNSINSLETKRLVQEIEVQYQVSEKENENLRIKSELRYQATINRFLNLGLLVLTIGLLVLGSFLWYTTKLKREKTIAYEVLMEKYRRERMIQNAQIEAEKPEKEVELFSAIITLFEKEKPFLDPLLKAEDVCDMLQVQSKDLSAALKSNGYKNFSQLVYHYRVEEARKLLESDTHNVYTIEAIAEMAGFGSRQSFYNSFEKLTGVKPAYYRANLKKNDANFPPES